MLYTIDTSYRRVGNVWYGTAKITGPRGTRTVQVSAPIPPGTSFKVSGEEVGWFGSDLVKAASKLAKNTVVKKLGAAVKAVVKSDITKVAVGTLAVAFPPVGVPAAAAFATASTVMSAAEKAGKYAGAAAGAAKLITKDPMKAVAIGIEASSGNPESAVAKLLAAGVKSNPKNPQAGIKNMIQKAQVEVRKGKQAKKVIAETIARTQKGDPQARKFLKTLSVAKQANEKMKEVKTALATTRQKKGILVLPSGELLKGSFATAGLARV